MLTFDIGLAALFTGEGLGEEEGPKSEEIGHIYLSMTHSR